MSELPRLNRDTLAYAFGLAVMYGHDAHGLALDLARHQVGAAPELYAYLGRLRTSLIDFSLAIGHATNALSLETRAAIEATELAA